MGPEEVKHQDSFRHYGAVSSDEDDGEGRENFGGLREGTQPTQYGMGEPSATPQLVDDDTPLLTESKRRGMTTRKQKKVHVGPEKK